MFIALKRERPEELALYFGLSVLLCLEGMLGTAAINHLVTIKGVR